MIYNVIKDNISFEIDDTVLLNNQSHEFQKVFYSLLDENIAEFDNAILVLLPTDRVLVNLINDYEDGKI